MTSPFINTFIVLCFSKFICSWKILKCPCQLSSTAGHLSLSEEEEYFLFICCLVLIVWGRQNSCKCRIQGLGFSSGCLCWGAETFSPFSQVSGLLPLLVLGRLSYSITTGHFSCTPLARRQFWCFRNLFPTQNQTWMNQTSLCHTLGMGKPGPMLSFLECLTTIFQMSSGWPKANQHCQTFYLIEW